MERNLFEKIHRINDLVTETDALYHQVSVLAGIPDSIMRVLYTIHDHGGESCLLSDIYKQTGISKQTVNSAIRRLEEEEVLYLEQYKGLSKKVLLTEKGKQLMEQTAGLLYETECKAFSDWNEAEIDEHIRLMEKYLTGFRSALAEK